MSERRKNNVVTAIAVTSGLLSAIIVVPAWANSDLSLEHVVALFPAGWRHEITALVIFLYIIAQLRTFLSPTVTAKIPKIIMVLLDFIAANYRYAKNAQPAEKPGDYKNVPSDQNSGIAAGGDPQRDQPAKKK